MLVRESLLISLAIAIVAVAIAVLAAFSGAAIINKGSILFDTARNGLPVHLPWLMGPSSFVFGCLGQSARREAMSI
jgi:hypothetical protein